MNMTKNEKAKCHAIIHAASAAAEAAASSAAGAAFVRALSQFLVGWIPGVGNAVNAGSAAAVTEAMGWRIANQFARQR